MSKKNKSKNKSKNEVTITIFNPHKLRDARNAKNLNRDKLCLKLNIAKDRLVKIEHFDVQPTNSEIERICNFFSLKKKHFETNLKISIQEPVKKVVTKEGDTVSKESETQRLTDCIVELKQKELLQTNMILGLSQALSSKKELLSTERANVVRLENHHNHQINKIDIQAQQINILENMIKEMTINFNKVQLQKELLSKEITLLNVEKQALKDFYLKN